MSAYLNALREEATREELLAEIVKLMARLEEAQAARERLVSDFAEAHTRAVEQWRKAKDLPVTIDTIWFENVTGFTGQPKQNPDGTYDYVNQGGTILRLGPGSIVKGWSMAPHSGAAVTYPPADAELTFETLRRANEMRQAEWCPGPQPDLSFRGNELAGEVGEACNVIKKLERERLGWSGSRDTLEHLGQELADVVICADLVAIAIGIDLAAEVTAKFNATSAARGLSTRLPSPATQQKGAGHE